MNDARLFRIGLTGGYGYSTTNVELPPAARARLPGQDKLALLQDDKKLRATARIVVS